MDVQSRCVEPFLLSISNLKDTDVLTARANAMVAPAAAYFKSTIMEKRKGQLDRMRAAQMFDPLFTKGTPATHASLVELKLFRMSEHPRLRKHLELAASEMHKTSTTCTACDFLVAMAAER